MYRMCCSQRATRNEIALASDIVVAAEIAVATLPVGTPVALAAEMAVDRIVAVGTQVAMQIDRTH